jgi:hypothetical protein
MGGQSHVFISHAHEDGPTAAFLVTALEREGVTCWIAPRDIERGASWDDAIVSALDQTSLFVLIFSRFSNVSRQVAKELVLADARRIDLRPVRLDQTSPSGGMEYHLSRPQWIDVSGMPDVEAQVGEIVRQLQGRAHVDPGAVVKVGEVNRSEFEHPDDWGRSDRRLGWRTRSSTRRPK